MSDHTVTLEFDHVGYTPTLRFNCQAAPDAECRTVCPRSECEEGCEHPDTHSREPLDYCNVVEWLENGDDVETWILNGSTEATLPVEIGWLGGCEGPEWRFAEAGDVS